MLKITELFLEIALSMLILIACAKANKSATNIAENENQLESFQDENRKIDIHANENMTKKITFAPLALSESLTIEIELIGEFIDPDRFTAYAKGEETRELFTLSELRYNGDINRIEYGNAINGMVKSAVFEYLTTPDKQNDIYREICYINGIEGYANLFRVADYHMFEIDDDCRYMCINESSDVPIVYIYDLQAIKKIKTVLYEPYRGKYMYPIEISFTNNAFKVVLSADTIFFTTIEIPIDNTNEYRVIDSYTEEDMQQGKPYQKF
jgi:hypothetical protein